MHLRIEVKADKPEEAAHRLCVILADTFMDAARSAGEGKNTTPEIHAHLAQYHAKAATVHAELAKTAPTDAARESHLKQVDIHAAAAKSHAEATDETVKKEAVKKEAVKTEAGGTHATSISTADKIKDAKELALRSHGDALRAQSNAFIAAAAQRKSSPSQTEVKAEAKTEVAPASKPEQHVNKEAEAVKKPEVTEQPRADSAAVTEKK